MAATAASVDGHLGRKGLGGGGHAMLGDDRRPGGPYVAVIAAATVGNLSLDRQDRRQHHGVDHQGHGKGLQHYISKPTTCLRETARQAGRSIKGSILEANARGDVAADDVVADSNRGDLANGVIGEDTRVLVEDIVPGQEGLHRPTVYVPIV